MSFIVDFHQFFTSFVIDSDSSMNKFRFFCFSSLTTCRWRSGSRSLKVKKILNNFYLWIKYPCSICEIFFYVKNMITPSKISTCQKISPSKITYEYLWDFDRKRFLTHCLVTIFPVKNRSFVKTMLLFLFLFLIISIKNSVKNSNI